MSAKNWEKYVRNILHIPYVSFENIDSSIIKVIVEVLVEAFRRYPILADSIITIGNKEYVNNLLELSYCADKVDWQNKRSSYDMLGDISSSTFVVTYYEKRGICYYLGLCLCPILEQLGYLSFEEYKLLNPNGHIPIDDSFLKPAVWHEVGHMLDFFLKISDSLAFRKIIKNHDIKNEISEYAMIDNSELLAESFAMYSLNKENELALKIGLLIDKEYLKYSKNFLLKEKFNVQKYYKLERKI